MRYLLNLTLALFFFLQAHAVESSVNIAYLEARENDPESIIENVSTIHGNYSDYEIDLVVPGPDSLVLSRFYSSEDLLLGGASLGGWRFHPHCFLSIQKEALAKTYTTAEGKFDYTHILIGTNEGSILTYAGWKNTTNPDARSLFKVDVEGSLLGLANIHNVIQNLGIWQSRRPRFPSGRRPAREGLPICNRVVSADGKVGMPA
ncbi:MAG: hypothetical protein KGJ02_08600 [Verrucomicrobiota bacterium]|nr:hypothetical protein [Verrucomicrobiota bacterium]